MRALLRTCGAVSLLGLFASGCANTPDAPVHYYLPKSKLRLEVIRTVTCDSVSNMIVASSVIPTVFHMADRRAHKSISVAKLDGYLSNSNIRFKFHDDGRLESINTTSTGQGASVLKSVISLAHAVVAASTSSATAGPVPSNNNEKDHSSACQYINDNGTTKDRTLTLKFEGLIEPESHENNTLCMELSPKLESSKHMEKLGEDLGKVSVKATWGAPKKPVTNRPNNDSDVMLTLREPADVTVEVSMGEGKSTADSWIGNFTMAQLGSEYEIPIPKATLFGKQTFSLAVEESGAVTEISYHKEAGVAQGIGVGQSLLDTFGPRAAAVARLAALKTEADLIAAQQRLVRCRAEPTTCR